MSFSEDNNLCDMFFEILDIDIKLGHIDPIRFGLENVKHKITVTEQESLSNQRIKLLDEYYHALIKFDRINIRKSPDTRISINMIRSTMIEGSYEVLLKEYQHELLDHHMAQEDFNLIIANYYVLKPPYIRPDSTIPQHIQRIYHESRWCFVYGNYNASIALSRTVIESVLKFTLKIDSSMRTSAGKVLKMASDRKILSNQARWKANKVISEANCILHRAHTTTKENSLISIDHVLDFIEDIYLT